MFSSRQILLNISIRITSCAILQHEKTRFINKKNASMEDELNYATTFRRITVTTTRDDGVKYKTVRRIPWIVDQTSRNHRKPSKMSLEQPARLFSARASLQMQPSVHFVHSYRFGSLAIINKDNKLNTVDTKTCQHTFWKVIYIQRLFFSMCG